VFRAPQKADVPGIDEARGAPPLSPARSPYLGRSTPNAADTGGDEKRNSGVTGERRGRAKGASGEGEVSRGGSGGGGGGSGSGEARRGEARRGEARRDEVR